MRWHSRISIAAFAVLACQGPARADWFIRGDADASGAADITDAVGVLQHLFSGGPAPACLAAADVDGDGEVAVNDAVALLSFLFLGGEPPALPFPGCGTYFAGVAPDCASYPPCGSLCVVFCLDRSADMSEAIGFERLKVFAIKNLFRLPPSAEFAILSFGIELSMFPAGGSPAVRTDVVDPAAIAYVVSLQAGPGSCSQPALLAALDIASRSAAATKVIVFVSSGFFITCPGFDPSQYAQETLEKVTKENTGAVRIDTVLTGDPEQFFNVDFLQQLAGQSGGTFSGSVR